MSAPHAFQYEQSDVPEGQTLSEWRAARERARREAQPPRRRDVVAARLAHLAGQHPAACACFALAFHVGHLALGLPALEGFEQAALSAAATPPSHAPKGV